MRTAAVVLIHAFAVFIAHGAFADACKTPQSTEASPQQIRDLFAARKMKVVTLVGYSGAGYEDTQAMLKSAGMELSKFDPQRTIVNIGATADGIGAVYELAKQRGFQTSGIVSTQARDQKVALSPCVDRVFYVKDSTWGGLLPGTKSLSPTSEAMVTSSDILIGIGGGDVARDELLAAKSLGKDVTFIPADMNHRLAREKAASKGLPAPTDFRGTAHQALASDKPSVQLR